jgi:Cu/Ag efflux pump CusA
MLASLIRWSIQNRFLVLMATLLLAAWGVHATLSTPLDALPTCPIRRSSFARNSPARRRRWSRTRSPIP